MRSGNNYLIMSHVADPPVSFLLSHVADPPVSFLLSHVADPPVSFLLSHVAQADHLKCLLRRGPIRSRGRSHSISLKPPFDVSGVV